MSMMPAPILTTTESTPIANGDKTRSGASINSPTTPTKFPGTLTRSNTLPHDFLPQSVTSYTTVTAAVATTTTDRTRLAPEDAIYLGSPPHKYSNWNEGRLRPNGSTTGNGNGHLSVNTYGPPGVGGGSGGNTRESSRTRRGRGRTKDGKERGSRSRGRKAGWKKLLWVKQSYPDNYTDRETFLEHLQRNPRLQPYDFWPLVADSTVIVQQVCAVTIFICCFVAIYQERISPITVAWCSTTATVIAWLVWDRWVRKEQKNPTRRPGVPDVPLPPSPAPGTSATHTPAMGLSAKTTTTSLVPENGMPKSDTGLGPGPMSRSHSQPPAAPGTSYTNSLQANLAALPSQPKHGNSTSASSLHSTNSALDAPPMPPPPRQHSRLATLKSALLIYCALLGLSPILKSLTRSTSSDSIWALSTWLLTINVFFFDYTDLNPTTSFLRPTFQASLSTNAALMASTVLASRLPSTEHVFSLTLFSIEVFGLFPVFRRHLRWQSWRGHIFLTAGLVVGAGAGVGVVVSGGGWKAALAGAVLGNILVGAAMGGASWWLIGLQRYKNEIHGPWDPARPVIRRWVDG